MNVLLGTFIGLLLVYLIAYTDFVLSRLLKERLRMINEAGWRNYSLRPVNWWLAVGLALLYWLPSVLLPAALYLEYRIMLTLLIWALLGGGLYWYLIQRTSIRLARQALPLLLAFAIAAGLLLGPLFNAIKDWLPL